MREVLLSLHPKVTVRGHPGFESIFTLHWVIFFLVNYPTLQKIHGQWPLYLEEEEDLAWVVPED